MASTTSSGSGDQLAYRLFAVNVRRARESKGLSVPELARRTGRKVEYIEAVEMAQVTNLKIREVKVFATALGVDEADLVGPQVP